ncbi:MAG: hypothetical protein IPP17_03940 [Bacteroidetes bacterium]|nr:hypothetical protein [Bacteroidota bacterium]
MAKNGSNGGRWFLVLLVFAGIAAGGYWLWYNRFSIRGIDVSRYQGKIEWAKVKQAGIRFAFIKATEGTDYVDPYFAVNWDEAKDKGIARGAYHFFRPAQDGKAQAEHFLKQVKWTKGDLPPVLDLEVTDEVTAAAIRRGFGMAGNRRKCDGHASARVHAPALCAQLPRRQARAVPALGRGPYFAVAERIARLEKLDFLATFAPRPRQRHRRRRRPERVWRHRSGVSGDDEVEKPLQIVE